MTRLAYLGTMLHQYIITIQVAKIIQQENTLTHYFSGTTQHKRTPYNVPDWYNLAKKLQRQKHHAKNGVMTCSICFAIHTFKNPLITEKKKSNNYFAKGVNYKAIKIAVTSSAPTK